MFRRGFVLTVVVVLTMLLFAVPAKAVSVASFTFSPSDPSIFDSVQFTDTSTPESIKTWAWDFGDGVASALQSPTHQYAADGDYTVLLKVTWLDASTAQYSQVVPVRSHDVMVSKIAAPKPAKVGKSGFITVSTRSVRYAETVQVEVLKSVNGSAFQSIGTLTQAVPLSTKNSSTDFKFSYTYSDTDRGSVVFKAVATIQGFRDCVPSNNEMSASPLTVK